MALLVHYPFCPRSRAIRIALAELGHDVTLAEELPWVWRQELLEINPSGELPVLVPAGADPVGGTYAISEYLDERGLAQTSDAGSGGLFPGSTAERAEVRRLVDWFMNKFDREVSRELFDMKITALQAPGKGLPPDTETLRTVRHNLRYHMRYVDHLALSRDWLAGARLSFADMTAAGQLSILDYLNEIDWEQYPSAKSWYMRLKSRPAFRSLLADRLPGQPPHRTYVDLDF
jgi:glutathione S-transferase